MTNIYILTRIDYRRATLLKAFSNRQIAEEYLCWAYIEDAEAESEGSDLNFYEALEFTTKDNTYGYRIDQDRPSSGLRKNKS